MNRLYQETDTAVRHYQGRIENVGARESFSLAHLQNWKQLFDQNRPRAASE